MKFLVGLLVGLGLGVIAGLLLEQPKPSACKPAGVVHWVL
jgi:gas vesicle protein